MGMNRSTYIGPYARCSGSKDGSPDNWAHQAIIDATGDERLYYANGESIQTPALFAPNASYDGQPDFGDAVEDGGEMEIKLEPVLNYVTAFMIAFQEEIAVLNDFFERVEIVFGVIVT